VTLIQCGEALNLPAFYSLMITIDSLYFNEIHQKWLPVPSHWVGTLPEEWDFEIYIPDHE
jgi:hypothetical protein